MDFGIVSFKLFAMLGSFRVLITDDRTNIADIRIQGTFATFSKFFAA